jgi:hypothetical protein
VSMSQARKWATSGLSRRTPHGTAKWIELASLVSQLQKPCFALKVLWFTYQAMETPNASHPGGSGQTHSETRRTSGMQA